MMKLVNAFINKFNKVVIKESVEKTENSLFHYEAKRQIEVTYSPFRNAIERVVHEEITWGRKDGRDLTACSLRGLEKGIEGLRAAKTLPNSEVFLLKSY